MAEITLSDGTVIPFNKTSPTGLLNAAYDPRTGGQDTPYVALGNRAQAEAVDPRVKNFGAGGGLVHVGYFNDPRKAAYAAAKFRTDPSFAMDIWSRRPRPGVRGEGRKFLQSLDQYYQYPQDLFTDLPADVEQIKALKAARARAPRDDSTRRVAGVDPAYREWNDYVKSLGIKTSQIAPLLPGGLEKNRDFLITLRDKPVDDAVAALRDRGIDLSDETTVARIKQQPLAESIDPLDRLLALTESVLRR